MKTKITPSAYDQPCRITSWGYAFDSLTELKYAVPIMEEHKSTGDGIRSIKKFLSEVLK